MIANSPAAVAAAFSTSSRPVWPGDSRCAAIPDPITTAARNALPKNSAVSRRHSRTGALVTPPILTEEDSSVKIESMSAERNSYLARRAAVHAALADPARLAITDMLLAGDASPSAPAAAAAAAAPAHQRGPGRRRPGGHGLRHGPRGTRPAGRRALVRPGPGPGR